MCWNGYDPPRDEDQWEDPDDADESWRGEEHQSDADDWRHGFPMGPEEQAFRKLIEGGEGEGGS